MSTYRTLVWDRHKFAEKCDATGLLAPDIGPLVGLRGQTIYAYRQGRGNPSADALGRLAAALNCRVDEFYSWADV